MIGTVLWALSRLQTSNPSSFGSIRSSTTRSTGSEANFASASSPSRAASTRKPSRSSGYERTFWTESSSSTRRMVDDSGTEASPPDVGAAHRPSPTIARGYGAAPAPTSAEAAAAGLARTARKRANLPRHSTPDCDPVARRCLHRRATRRAAAVLVPIGVRPAGGGRGDARARPSVPHPSPGRPGRRRRRRLGRRAVPLVWVRRAARAVRGDRSRRGGRFRSRTCTRSPRGARTRPSWSWPIATTWASAPRPTTTPREPVRCSSSPEATGFARGPPPSRPRTRSCSCPPTEAPSAAWAPFASSSARRTGTVSPRSST